MPVEELRHYVVTPYKGPHDIDHSPEQHLVKAASAEVAAELILGEKLVPFGRSVDLRAKVSFSGLNGQLKTVLLYRPSDYAKASGHEPA